MPDTKETKQREYKEAILQEEANNSNAAFNPTKTDYTNIPESHNQSEKKTTVGQDTSGKTKKDNLGSTDAPSVTGNTDVLDDTNDHDTSEKQRSDDTSEKQRPDKRETNETIIPHQDTSGKPATYDSGDAYNFITSNKNIMDAQQAYKVALLEKQAARIVGDFVVESVSEGTEFKVGTRPLEIEGAAILFALDAIRRSCGRSMASTYRNEISDLFTKAGLRPPGWKVKSRKDVNYLITEVNRLLKANGFDTIHASNMAVAYREINKLLRNPNLDDKTRDALKGLKKAVKVGYMKAPNRGIRKLKHLGMKYSIRYLRQNELGQGLFFITNLVKRGKQVLRTGLSIIKTNMKIGIFAAKKAAAAAGWVAAKLAQTAPVKIVTEPIKAALDGSKKVQSAKATAKKARNKTRRARTRFGNARSRLRAFRRDPFGIRKWGQNISQRFLNSAIGTPFRFVRFVKTVVGNLFATVALFVSAAINALLVLAAGVVVLCVLLSLLVTLLTTIMGFFDLSANDDVILQAAANEIKSCYMDQQEELANLSYDTVTIIQNDIKNTDVYDGTGIDDIEETTNTMEMLSMAQVYFDFDLSDAGKSEVLDYIDKLYKVSHPTETNVTTRQVLVGTDEDGEKQYETKYDATVTVSTYYFDEIFDLDINSADAAWNGDMSGLPSWFTTDIIEAALDIQERTKYPAAICLAQCILETGGSDPSGLATKANNILGIKYHTSCSYVSSYIELDTKEEVDGVKKTVKAKFASYASMGDCVHCWEHIVGKYDGVKDLAAKSSDICDPYSFLKIIAPHYATDSSYVNSVWNVVQKYNLERFNISSVSSTEGTEIVKYACQFIGNPYVYGGTSLTSGTDCSGFTMGVYKHFGYSLPRTSTAQRNVGKAISTTDRTKWQPGDIICMSGHVGIFAGVENGKYMMVHASSPKYGIVKTTVEWSNKKVVAVRRVIKNTSSESISASTSDEQILAACIQAEACSHYVDKLAVGAVICNRVKSSKYPNTIKEVIKQKGQFSTWSSGKVQDIMNKGPNSDSLKAAKEAIAGNYDFKYTSFRSHGSTKYGGTMVCTSCGNRYK